MAQHLKLRAGDEEDISIISACMQDALISGRDISFLPGENRFVMVAQRFRWENCPEFMRPDLMGMMPCESYERVNTVLVFDDVTGVRLFDLKPSDGNQILELLAIAIEPGEESGDGPSVILFFAGGGAIRLEVGRVLCHLEDLGDAWPTTRRPCHPVDEGA
jgi:hypothetical protein